MKMKFKVRFMNKNFKGHHKTHFEFEKVLKSQGDKCQVKWIGYPKSFNSWIDMKAMVN